jgi:hypothetical protein
MPEIRTTHPMTLTVAGGSRPPEGPIHEIFEVL